MTKRWSCLTKKVFLACITAKGWRQERRGGLKTETATRDRPEGRIHRFEALSAQSRITRASPVIGRELRFPLAMCAFGRRPADATHGVFLRSRSDDSSCRYRLRGPFNNLQGHRTLTRPAAGIAAQTPRPPWQTRG